MPKLLLITADSEGWAEFVYQNNRRHGNNHLRIKRADEKETAAGYEAEAAMRESLVGNMALAKQQAQAALALSNGRDVAGISATALARAGALDLPGRQRWRGLCWVGA